MTLFELLDYKEIQYEMLQQEKGMYIFRIGCTNVLYLSNDGNQFKVKRRWIHVLEKNASYFSMLLRDRNTNKLYFLSLRSGNNWVTNCFNDCEKSELYLGKQVLNHQMTIQSIIKELGTY